VASDGSDFAIVWSDLTDSGAQVWSAGIQGGSVVRAGPMLGIGLSPSPLATRLILGPAAEYIAIFNSGDSTGLVQLSRTRELAGVLAILPYWMGGGPVPFAFDRELETYFFARTEERGHYTSFIVEEVRCALLDSVFKPLRWVMVAWDPVL